jgi:hypothetical protein
MRVKASFLDSSLANDPALRPVSDEIELLREGTGDFVCEPGREAASELLSDAERELL